MSKIEQIKYTTEEDIKKSKIKLLADYIFDTADNITEDELPSENHWSWKQAEKWLKEQDKI